MEILIISLLAGAWWWGGQHKKAKKTKQIKRAEQPPTIPKPKEKEVQPMQMLDMSDLSETSNLQARMLFIENSQIKKILMEKDQMLNQRELALDMDRKALQNRYDLLLISAQQKDIEQMKADMMLTAKQKDMEVSFNVQRMDIEFANKQLNLEKASHIIYEQETSLKNETRELELREKSFQVYLSTQEAKMQASLRDRFYSLRNEELRVNKKELRMVKKEVSLDEEERRIASSREAVHSLWAQHNQRVIDQYQREKNS